MRTFVARTHSHHTREKLSGVAHTDSNTANNRDPHLVVQATLDKSQATRVAGPICPVLKNRDQTRNLTIINPFKHFPLATKPFDSSLVRPGIFIHTNVPDSSFTQM